ncbi:hypothetical protein LWI28_025600 [Acer negundo]|uniref:Uncharacterized protein n=1 Tax=Acer negundo TaxID=4023 RepID=A0AAD5JQY3_ACENE|nr:hypothetical protein LWI28_025600 [Acer negundo]
MKISGCSRHRLNLLSSPKQLKRRFCRYRNDLYTLQHFPELFIRSRRLVDALKDYDVVSVHSALQIYNDELFSNLSTYKEQLQQHIDGTRSREIINRNGEFRWV